METYNSGDKATYEIVTGEAPDVGEETVVARVQLKLMNLSLKLEKRRVLGYHVSLTGKLDITQSGTNTKLQLIIRSKGKQNFMNYMPADIAANFLKQIRIIQSLVMLQMSLLAQLQTTSIS